MRRRRRPALTLAAAAVVLGLGTGALAYAGVTREAGPAGEPARATGSRTALTPSGAGFPTGAARSGAEVAP